MLLTRRRAMVGAAGGLAMLIAPRLLAQAGYPNRVIKLIVPYPAGGTTDLLAGLAAEGIKSEGDRWAAIVKAAGIESE